MNTAEQLNHRGHPIACDCTACELERQLDRTPRTEPAGAPPYSSSEYGMAGAIAELAALRGVEFPASVVHRCECGLEVAVRATLCPTCADASTLAIRRMVLAKAWRSLPEGWEHAEIGPRCPAHRDLLAAVATWTRDRGQLLLLGRTGVGKSTSAVAGARRILRRAEAQAVSPNEMAFAAGLRWVRARDLVEDRKNHPLGDRSEPPLFRAAAKATLLILDEVGFEPADVQHGTVARLLEHRYDASSKRTWVTSGLTSSGFSDRYGVALGRKLGIDEPERGQVVEVFGA